MLTSNFIIKKVNLVKGMKFNPLSISQLYDIRYKIKFHSTKYLVKQNELVRNNRARRA